MPEAILHVPHGGLRIETDCSTDEQWADCGLHFGRPAGYPRTGSTVGQLRGSATDSATTFA
eukprot:10631755-Alexandrium_andersonii.AAC.1